MDGSLPVHAARLAFTAEGQEVRTIKCPEPLSDIIHSNLASQMKEKRRGKEIQHREVVLSECLHFFEGGVGMGGRGVEGEVRRGKMGV